MKKSKKQGKRIDVLVIPKKKVIILNILKAVGTLAVIAALFMPARLKPVPEIMIVTGAVSALFSRFAREYYYRCPGCGECLLKKQSIKNKLTGTVPKNCPKCSWHCNIELK